MEENNQAVAATEEKTKTPFSAKAKEWFRKKIVNLKRRPNNIPLVLFAITSVLYFIWLSTYSQALYPWSENTYLKWTGLMVFINVLLSLLVLVSHIYAFPKRQKPKIMFLVLVVVMTVVMIVCDIVYYVRVEDFLAAQTKTPSNIDYIDSSLNLTIAHIVLLGVCLVVFLLLPVYSKLINKINTKVEVESATGNISDGAIDIQED
ncbi:MAG: hypothetical protein LUD27_05675 [Clostridia bacterium]|nr:hypothetical protein [Clostridia bacterium]